ncbi:MAG TPA: hypothetical protein VME23_03255 [Terracidiphilus sp.]|nr:hypothetical protein [Terracidiphilus sp.]
MRIFKLLWGALIACLMILVIRYTVHGIRNAAADQNARNLRNAASQTSEDFRRLDIDTLQSRAAAGDAQAQS